MLLEYRQYRCHPGRRADWVRYMEEVIIPFQVSRGMVIVGTFVDEEDPDQYIWMRRFDDEAHREKLHEAVHATDQWKDIISPRIPDMVIHEEIKVTRLVPTSLSMLR
ncbi:MAG: NIPSNAP family containing protein [Actinomycetia bacterium]|nr:NIPSNAP family containing protein [Actinomycetes bacterium]MCP3911991.1 NIPSNAP family containing protein [Actinomycetes bacterium]MCP4083496.1 NIPSNAP family containing protein [Actinomycetes bacterium]